MNILVACEESQRVCIEFRKKGHEGFSCDIQEPSGGHPEWHILGDVLAVLNPYDTVHTHGILFSTMDGTEHFVKKWDLVIAHPPCTHLTVTGNRWFNIKRYGDKARKRIKDREIAVKFFMSLVNADCERIAIENPVGYMNTLWRKPDQIIHPYMFGDPFEKRTCLWVKNLPKLVPTDEVRPPERVKYASGKTMPAWFAEAWRLSPKERAKVRSKTFPGIAKAMAEQWSEFINAEN